MKWLKDRIRQVLERWFLEQHRSPWTSSDAQVKASQLALYMQYRQMLAQGIVPNFNETGMRVFSGTDDDGILLFIFAAIGFKSRVCVDIGAADGTNSNCANLILNFNFRGLLIEGDAACVSKGTSFYAHHPDTVLYPPIFRQALVTAENINQLVEDAGLSGEIDLLSIDIDGNDFWVWKALAQVQPRVVIIETHTEFGERNIVVPYDSKYHYPGRHPQYHGASPAAMVEMGRKKGYRLVAANSYGFNFIFVQENEGTRVLPTITVDDAVAHPRNRERQKLAAEIATWPYISA